jgi:hypothetical protein
VALRYDPHKPRKQVEVWYDGKDFGLCRLLDRYANTKVKRSTTIKGAVVEQNVGEHRSVHVGLVAAGLTRSEP